MSENKDIQGIRLAVRVTPNASYNRITGLKDGVLQVKINAPPEKGKANEEFLTFMAERTGVKKSFLTIIKGQTSRDKVILIQGISNDELIRKMQIKGKREGG